MKKFPEASDRNGRQCIPGKRRNSTSLQWDPTDWKCCILIIMTTQWRRKTSKVFFIKIFTSHIICSVCVWEGVGDRTELQYFDPHSYGHQPCVFLVLQGCSTGGPEAHSAGFLYHILSATSLDPNSSGAQRAPSAWCGFPYTISSITSLLSNWLTSVLTELYNRSTPTRSPTQSLEWHVWSSSSGNNCHAVQRSLSSGALVYECTMGFLACPILLANFRPRDFLS